MKNMKEKMEEMDVLLNKLIGLLCLLLGILTVWNPNMWWEIMENWRRYKGEKPTKKWIRMTKITGFVYILLGLALIL